MPGMIISTTRLNTLHVWHRSSCPASSSSSLQFFFRCVCPLSCRNQAWIWPTPTSPSSGRTRTSCGTASTTSCTLRRCSRWVENTAGLPQPRSYFWSSIGYNNVTMFTPEIISLREIELEATHSSSSLSKAFWLGRKPKMTDVFNVVKQNSLDWCNHRLTTNQSVRTQKRLFSRHDHIRAVQGLVWRNLPQINNAETQILSSQDISTQIFR